MNSEKNERNGEELSQGDGIENTKQGLNCFSNFLCFSSKILPSFLRVRVMEGIVPVKKKGGGGVLLSSISAAPKGMGFEKFWCENGKNGIDFDHYGPKS